MAPIYGISQFIQVEFVVSGSANPCLFHGVNYTKDCPCINTDKPAFKILFSTWTLQPQGTKQGSHSSYRPLRRLPSIVSQPNNCVTEGVLPLWHAQSMAETSRSECP
ncbi:hypothetical protein NC652_024473 [Populus alba x Populus x berolinensis]|nr:hypothetical protein NC652_024473 [Populus alba x Populus x berolinensis]